jgi:hypothetical protein
LAGTAKEAAWESCGVSEGGIGDTHNGDYFGLVLCALRYPGRKVIFAGRMLLSLLSNSDPLCPMPMSIVALEASDRFIHVKLTGRQRCTTTFTHNPTPQPSHIVLAPLNISNASTPPKASFIPFLLPPCAPHPRQTQNADQKSTNTHNCPTVPRSRYPTPLISTSFSTA